MNFVMKNFFAPALASIVTLGFAPVAKADQYGAMESIYDVFWCNVHGKGHGQMMRGEVAIIVTRGEIGGG